MVFNQGIGAGSEMMRLRLRLPIPVVNQGSAGRIDRRIDRHPEDRWKEGGDNFDNDLLTLVIDNGIENRDQRMMQPRGMASYSSCVNMYMYYGVLITSFFIVRYCCIMHTCH